MELSDFFLLEYVKGSILPDLKQVINTASTASVRFRDGSKTKVTPTSAKIMVAAHSSLASQKKVKFDTMISSDRSTFDKTLNSIYGRLRGKL